jgi:hypothetical protein
MGKFCESPIDSNCGPWRSINMVYYQYLGRTWMPAHKICWVNTRDILYPLGTESDNW